MSQTDEIRGWFACPLTIRAADADKIISYNECPNEDVYKTIASIKRKGEKMNPILLGVYRHYKGNQYEVIGIAKHSETLESMVIYTALYGERGTWVRPLSMWSNPIEVDGKTVKRFEYIGEAD